MDIWSSFGFVAEVNEVGKRMILTNSQSHLDLIKGKTSVQCISYEKMLKLWLKAKHVKNREETNRDENCFKRCHQEIWSTFHNILVPIEMVLHFHWYLPLYS